MELGSMFEKTWNIVTRDFALVKILVTRNWINWVTISVIISKILQSFRIRQIKTQASPAKNNLILEFTIKGW